MFERKVVSLLDGPDDPHTLVFIALGSPSNIVRELISVIERIWQK